MSKAEKTRKSHSPALRLVVGIFGVIVLVVAGFAIRYWSAFDNFLNKITGGEPESKQYSVVVLESSEVQSLDNLTNKNIGFLGIDEKVGNAEQHLKDNIQFESNFYNDLDTLATVLNNKIVDAITLETDNLEVLKDEASDLMKDVKVIYTFEIEVASENVAHSERK